MITRKFNLRNVIAIAICLAGTVVFTGCEKNDTPTAVTNFTVTTGDKQISLAWDAPSNNGGSEITGYEVTMDNWATKVTKTSSEKSHTYTGLTNGTQYTFKVRAVNANGAGAESSKTATPSDGTINETFSITSSAFKNNDRLADKYCNFSSNISLPFEWQHAPEDVKSYALVIHDPQGGNWIHWAVFNIPKNCTSIAEGASGTNKMPAGCIELKNEFSTNGYGGPQPPPGTGTHNYIVRLYALNVTSIDGISKNDFKNYSSINGLLANKIIEQAEIIGTYSR